MKATRTLSHDPIEILKPPKRTLGLACAGTAAYPTST